MNDIVKHYREKHPWLDFIAGFIPGVGEAQDIQDFAHAVKDKDWLIAGTSLLGLALPVVTGGQATKLVKAVKKHLPDSLKSKGWKEIDGRIFDPKGEEYIYNSEGRLNPAKSFKETQAHIDKAKKAEKAAKEKAKRQQKIILDHNDKAEEFRQRSGLDYSLENWQSLASGHKMSDKEIELFTKKAFPSFVKTYDELIKSGKLIRQPNGRYTAYFDSPVSKHINPKSKLAETWGAGYRKDLNNIETMYYVQANSPQGRNLLYNGIPMRSGIKDKHSFETGKNNQNYEKWFDSDPRGSQAYGQLQIWGLPVRPSIINPQWDDNIRLIKRQTANPSSNSWAGPNRPINAYLSPDKASSINMSEGSLIDDHATQVLNTRDNPVKGVFTIVGEDIPVKSVFGGSGMYDTSPKNLYNPFMSFVLPIGFAGTLGYRYFNNSKDEKER